MSFCQYYSAAKTIWEELEWMRNNPYDSRIPKMEQERKLLINFLNNRMYPDVI